MVFTLIFAEFGIDYEGEDTRKLLHIDRYDDQSLNYMGYQKVNARCLHRAFGQGATTSDTSDDSDDGSDNDNEEDEEDKPHSLLATTTLMLLDHLLHSHHSLRD